MKKTYIPALTALLFISGALNAQKVVTAATASKHIGEKVSLHAKVLKGEVKQNGKTTSTQLFIEGSNNLAIIIDENARKSFTCNPEDFFVNKDVWVTGRVIDARGKVGIAISKAEDLKVEQTSGGDLELKPLDINTLNRFSFR